jgi:UDP-N-acetylglucosamine--N-acetylmuramyl-(pentapeptide) pyrophosphoryl-undecaprenol N-acetylglucosamine transferase
VATVVIAAGGTAGHVVPALAVADALCDRGAQVSFIGTRERAEAELVPGAGYEIDFVAVRGLDRRNPLRAVAAAARAAFAVPAARRILRRRNADVVMGGGGYVAGPVGLAAALSRIPLVLTEADSHLGLANRLLAGRARRVCLAFPLADREGPRYLLTGRPVPAAVLTADRGEARRRFGIAPGSPCLLVFGGSLGALSINEAALAAFAGEDGAARQRPYHVLHIAGHRDYAEAAGRVGGTERYTLLEYEPSLGDALAACDLVLARAGGSVFELAAAGRPAVLVPYPHASGGHQHANAAWMVRAGAAVVIEDSDLDSVRLAKLVGSLLSDPSRLAPMAKAAGELGRPDAATRIADEILGACDPT